MILKGAEIARYLARPDPTRPALLIYGQDAMRVALKRAEAVKALVGPGAEEEMRLTRIPGSDLRKDPAQLLDAVKAVGVPTIEVHISDPDTREEFRKVSYIRAACIASIKGHGLEGYLEALRLLAQNRE